VIARGPVDRNNSIFSLLQISTILSMSRSGGRIILGMEDAYKGNVDSYYDTSFSYEGNFMIYVVPDTCMIFGYVNETEAIHHICDEVFNLIFTSRFLTGLMLDVVHNEFEYTLNYKTNEILEKFVEYYKQVNVLGESEAVLQRIRREEPRLATLINFFLEYVDFTNIDDLISILVGMTNAREILRERKMELSSRLQRRDIADNPEIQRMMSGLEYIGISDQNDRSILAKAAYLNQKIPTVLITMDGVILEKRSLIIPIVNDLSILWPPEFLDIYSKM